MSVTTLTPIVASTNAPGAVPVTSTLPPNTSDPASLSVRAFTSGTSSQALMERRAEIFVFGPSVRMSSQALARCLAPGSATANAFTTPNDVLFTIATGAGVRGRLTISHSLNVTPNGMHSVEVDVSNDGSVDFVSTDTAPNTGPPVTIDVDSTSDLQILVRSSTLANLGPNVLLELVNSELRITLDPRTTGSSVAGCIPDLLFNAEGRLDGGIDFVVRDLLAGGSPIGANVIVLGPILPTPMPLPLSAQCIGLAGSAAAPALHSSAPAQIVFR